MEIQDLEKQRETLDAQILELRQEIERLKNLSFSNTYAITAVEQELKQNGGRLVEAKEKLKSLLSES
jgi:predicted  nucleic acid-binding Zn-ribbon protein